MKVLFFIGALIQSAYKKILEIILKLLSILVLNFKNEAFTTGLNLMILKHKYKKKITTAPFYITATETFIICYCKKFSIIYYPKTPTFKKVYSSD